MIYKYRWYLMVSLNFFVILLEYCFVVSPWLSDAIYLSTKEKQLLKQINQLNMDKIRFNSKHLNSAVSNTKRPLYSFEKNEFENISDFVRLLEMHGMRVESIKLLSSRHVQRKLFRFTIQGQFNQFYSFLSSFILKAYPIIILDFSSQVIKHNKLLIAINILLLQKSISNFVIPNSSFRRVCKYSTNEVDLSHPFCPEAGFSAENHNVI